MGVPDTVRKQKPNGFGALEIRDFGGGKYYVYQVTSAWDAEKQRSRKVTGKSIGKITEADGFIPNATGLKLMQTLRMIPEVAPVVRNYGAYEVLLQISPDIDEQLRKHFPDIFREIRTLSLLRLVDGASSKMVQPLFSASYLSDLCPDLASSEASIRNFVARLGSLQPRIDEFMRDSVLPGTSLLFDGTTIFTRSTDSLAEKGYNPKRNLNTQARILYVFEKDSKRPVFYRILQGSIVDKAAFIDTVKDSGCRDCTILADKGFYSKPNLSALMQAGMNFILPLQCNTSNVEQAFYENKDDRKFDGVFSYKGRTVWYSKKRHGTQGNWIYTFRDDARQQQMRSRYVEKAEKQYEEEEHAPMDVLNEVRLGYFSFCSNLDTDAKEIYLAYKERWDIEQLFDYLKNTVAPCASYAHNDDYFRGWAFLNHISLLYFYGLVNALKRTKQNEKYTAEEVLKLTKNIFKVQTDTGIDYRVSAIQKKTQELLDLLGVDLLR